MQAPAQHAHTRTAATTQSSPELQKLFGEDPEAGENMMSPYITTTKPPSRGMLSIRPIIPTHAKTGGMDTPRGEMEELTDEQLLQLELEKVKREREVLMNSILAARDQAGAAGGAGGPAGSSRGRRHAVHAMHAMRAPRLRSCCRYCAARHCMHTAQLPLPNLPAGTCGGEAQHNDIKSLRREIELKKAKLNELREETRRWAVRWPWRQQWGAAPGAQGACGLRARGPCTPRPQEGGRHCAHQ